LTIKLTQHVPFDWDPAEPRLKGLAALLRFHRVCAANWLAISGEDSRTRARRQVRLSTLRYSRANLQLLHYANLDIRAMHAYFLQLSKIVVPFAVADRNISAPGGAQHRFGADVANYCRESNSRTIKNPASSAGRVRPLSGSLCPSNLKDGIARFSTSFYPVFVTNLTSVRRQTRSVRRNPDVSEVHRHQESISIFRFSSSVYKLFL